MSVSSSTARTASQTNVQVSGYQERAEQCVMQWIESSYRVDKEDKSMRTPTSRLHKAVSDSTFAGGMSLSVPMFGKLMVKLGFSNFAGQKFYIQTLAKQVRIIEGVELL
jgi:hypothetical protein